jgi:hypothetical protein
MLLALKHLGKSLAYMDNTLVRRRIYRPEFRGPSWIPTHRDPVEKASRDESAVVLEGLRPHVDSQSPRLCNFNIPSIHLNYKTLRPRAPRPDHPLARLTQYIQIEASHRHREPFTEKRSELRRQTPLFCFRNAPSRALTNSESIA